MSLAKELKLAVKAGQSGIHVKTDELTDAVGAIMAWCAKTKGQVEARLWTRSTGLQAAGPAQAEPEAPAPPLPGLAAPGKAARKEAEKLLALLAAFADEPPAPDGQNPKHVLLVVTNFHLPFERQREELAAVVQEVVEVGKETRKVLVGLTPPEAKLPPEVEPLFSVIEHELPDEAELEEIHGGLDLAGRQLPAPETLKTACKAALGLTRLQAEGVFSVSYVRSGRLDPMYVWEEKAKILNREGLVELEKNGLTFANVGGLEGAKHFLKRLCAHDPLEDEDPDARAKGVVAVGPPGVGKSLLAYCLGNELGVVTLKANPGNLMDMYVGQTERNTRKFFQICRRMAPCVVIMDEVGQVMPSGGGHDDSSGVAKRMLGSFLTQMQDIEEPIFWFFTSNDVENLHEAFLRAERVDAKLYVRLPGAAQRAVIWRMYLRKFFPEKVKGEDDPRHVNTDAPALVAAYRKLKKVNTWDYGAKLAAALMGVPAGPERDLLLADVAAADDNLRQAVEAHLFDDEGWTPAEIRSCCRLARRLNLSLRDTSRRIGHVCMGEKGRKMLQRLDRWAANDGAIDAETGELFAPEAGGGPAPKKEGKVRRRIRTLDDGEE